MKTEWTLEEIEAELATPLPRPHQSPGVAVAICLLILGVLLANRNR